MGLRSLTGKPTYYPNTKEMSAGEVLFEKATLVDHAPSQNYPNSINFFFELPEAITTEKGTTNRMGISAGQITKAMSKLDEDFDKLIGRDFRLVYEGTNVLTKGPFKGKDAKAFTLQVYDSAEKTTNADETGAGVDVDKVAAAQARVNESKQGASGTDALDDMMN